MLLVQNNAGLHPKTINKAIRLFSGLANLDYKSGYNDHVYFKYLSNNKNDISLLSAYYPKEIYELPNTHECIDGNLPLCLILDIDVRQKPDPMNPELPSLDGYKISHKDLLSKILITYADIIYSDLNHFIILNAFALASSFNTNK